MGMKKLLCILFLAGFVTLGIYYLVVWWIIGIAIILVIALVYFVLSSFDKGHDAFMKNKFGENYEQLMDDGKLRLRTACSCQPDPRYTSIDEIRKKSGISFPTFVVSECKETLGDFTGDYSGEAIIEFSTTIDGNNIKQIEDNM